MQLRQLFSSDRKLFVKTRLPHGLIKSHTLPKWQDSGYAVINKSQKPSALLIKLAFRGNGLPLVFHPLGSQMLNERAAMIDPTLSSQERADELEKLANNIIATDGEVTSLTIPYPDGKSKYIYINSNNEFAVKSGKRETIYHYDEDNDSFEKEIVFDHNR